MKKLGNFIFATVSTILLTAGLLVSADTATTIVHGYVLDSACAFTKDLQKPVSKQCAIACAKAGSPLVILSEDGNIYRPIASTTPSSGQNSKLLPFAGEKVVAKGTVYKRGGSTAVVIDKLEAQSGQK